MKWAGWYVIVVGLMIGVDGVGTLPVNAWVAGANLALSIAVIFGGIVLLRKSKSK